MEYLIWGMKFLIIGIIYVLLFKIIKIMYLDLKGKNKRENKENLGFALEVKDAPGDVGVKKGNVYPIHTITNIGRNEENNIIIDDQYVSSHHARIVIKDNNIIISDLKSTNGVVVNGIKIKQPMQLSDGDTIEIGRVMFSVME